MVLSGGIVSSCSEYGVEQEEVGASDRMSRPGGSAFHQDPETNLIEGFWETPQGDRAFRFYSSYTWVWVKHNESSWIIYVSHRDTVTGQILETWAGVLVTSVGDTAPDDIMWVSDDGEPTGSGPPVGASPGSGSGNGG